MNVNWKYYNHAIIPDCAPHEVVDTTPIKNGSIWKTGGGYPLLARWTTDFDCGEATEFWYVIKDDTYDIQSLKAKRRYEITKARRFFEVRRIDPIEFSEELFKVQIAAFEAYPEKYRPTVNHDLFVEQCKEWNGFCFGAFLKDEEGNSTEELCGYSYLLLNEKCINFSVQKTKPLYECKGVNAALVDGILCFFSEALEDGAYICDGARSISHETEFQNYLEKYFGFRKAYCKLHVAYRPCIKWLVPILFGARNILKKFDNIGLIHLINSVLIMEEIKRKCQ